MADKTEVVQREDVVYGEGLDAMLEYYRGIQKVLQELGFDEIEEERSEHWENLPFKQTIYADKWKDPFTKVQIKIKARVKTPRADRRTGSDLYKGIFFISGYVVRAKYPHWEYWEEKTWFKRSAIYKFFMRVLKSIMFQKEFEKYKEEAEELTIEITSRIREYEGSIPAIGKSKREWYQPDFRERR
ncbi:MAG: hypothetical protein SVU32_08080 [Candidatus Nanohaloarchaea archaeon]|nr:hypothetical protein [Candidatus Nanohaloarchaea archaeon]